MITLKSFTKNEDNKSSRSSELPKKKLFVKNNFEKKNWPDSDRKPKSSRKPSKKRELLMVEDQRSKVVKAVSNEKKKTQIKEME